MAQLRRLGNVGGSGGVEKGVGGGQTKVEKGRGADGVDRSRLGERMG